MRKASKITMSDHSTSRKNFISIGLLLLSTGFLISGYGLMNTVLSLRLKLAGESSLFIGIISAVYFIGMLIGSLKASVFIRLVGYVNSFATLVAIMAITTILPGMSDNIYVLFICRFIQGFCLAGLYIIIESWLLNASPEALRGKILAMYMIVLYGAYSLGQLFLHEDTIATIAPFCVSSMLVTAAIVPLCGFMIITPVFEKYEAVGIRAIYNASPSGFLGCLISGIFIAAIYSIFPLYIEEIMHNTENVAIVMAVTFLSGGVLVQYHLGALSDKVDRQKIQITLNLIFTLLLFIATFLEYYKLVNFSLLIVIAAVIGIFCLTIYPISLNLVCDNLKKSELMQGIEGLTIVYGIGSIIGPIYVSFFINIFGFAGYPTSYLLLTLFLSIFTILEYKKKKKINRL